MSPVEITNGDAEKQAGVAVTAAPDLSSPARSDHDDKNETSDIDSDTFQPGVQRVRAITETWSKQTLWLMFALLYLVAFVDALLSTVQDSLNPYITSNFGQHGLLATVGIVSTIISGCSRLTLAKVVDIWGRPIGFIVNVTLVLIGLIMKATAKNMPTYVGANVLYWTGHIGMLYIIDIMLADMTTLRNRMIMFGVNETPTIASTFAGPRIADLFYSHLNFRWAFGAFAFILVGVCLPVALIMLFMQRRAIKRGTLVVEKSGRTILQSITYYVIELDVIGIILITATFSLILLPFSIVSYAPRGWRTPYIIAMEVVGCVCLGLFAAWERFLAPVQFLPWRYLREPTLVGSCVLYAVMFCSIYCWNAYFGSYLQVVNRLSITTSGYVLNAMSLTSAFLGPIIGYLISYTGEFKWTAYAGVPFMLVGTAVIIPLRQPDVHVGLLTMTQVLVGIGSGLFAVCAQLAVMAVVTHQEVAVVVAIWGMFGSVGAAVGLAIAGALWNNLFPSELARRLPEAAKDQAAAIFADIEVQKSFADGSAEREAVVGAYGEVMRKMVIVGVAFMPLVLASIYIWRNVNVKELEKEKGAQTRGNVW